LEHGLEITVLRWKIYIILSQFFLNVCVYVDLLYVKISIWKQNIQMELKTMLESYSLSISLHHTQQW
jgi:hypothetical protein